MRQSRLAVIKAASGAAFAIPTFSGSHAIFGDATQGYIECYSSGTVSFPEALTVDIFVINGGKNGLKGSYDQGYSGAGGNGGAYTTVKSLAVQGDYTVSVASAQGSSSVSGLVSSPKTPYSTGANSSATPNEANRGKAGTNPFGDSTFVKVGGSGGGGLLVTTSRPFDVPGGVAIDGGGNGGGYNAATYKPTDGEAGAANTGGGGGGGGVYANSAQANYGKGGSGLVIIRWGYAA